MNAPAEKSQSQTSPGTDTLLFVDHDRKALTALRRLLRPLGYRVLLATGGLEALAVLEKAQVDVLVSAMRLPRMNGTEFLAQAAERWPHVLRILVVQYSDMPSAVRSIKAGRIYRYLLNPWNDDDLKLLIAQAVEHRHLLKDKLHLLAAIRRQKHELVRVSNDLEAKVQERTAELLRTAGVLRNENQKLRESNASAVQVAVGVLAESLGLEAARAFLGKQESQHDPAVVQALLENLEDDAADNKDQRSEPETKAGGKGQPPTG